MVELKGKQVNYLRSLAHHLKVVVSVGSRGITPSVVDELEAALRAHELVKVKLSGEDKTQRRRCMERLCAASGSVAVQMIGKTGVVYRAGSKPTIRLPE